MSDQVTIFVLFSFSIVAQPGLDQPPVVLRNPNQRDYLIGGLKPNTKYRVQVRARNIAGLSTSPAMIELTTNFSLSKYSMTEVETILNRTFVLVPSKPTFRVTYRGPTFFNVSFDPTRMTIPGSLYYVQYKEDEKGSYAETFSPGPIPKYSSGDQHVIQLFGP